MSDYSITISLDDAFDCYQVSKRKISKVSIYCYDLENNEFIKIKGELRKNCIPFINSYTVCCNLIDEYLDQPHIKEFKEDCIKSIKNAKYRNKIIDFLWFFDHIDDCTDFENFEIICMTKILKKWCKENGFSYLEPEVYVAQNRN